MLACQDCEKAGGIGYFADKGAHDRHVKNPWNDHKLTDVDVVTDKASWMLSCPVCKDAAAVATPEVGYTTTHLTVGMNENGDEIVRCSACGKLYLFNLKWTFEKKEAPPKAKEQWTPGRLYMVRRDPQDDDFEMYLTLRSANERVQEFEGEALEAAGYTKIDEDEWASPFGTRLDHDRAVQEAIDESAAEMPEAPQEVDVLD